MNEWPEPTGFTFSPSAPALRSTSASSSTDAGDSVRAGLAVTVPAQLCHVLVLVRA